MLRRRFVLRVGRFCSGFRGQGTKRGFFLASGDDVFLNSSMSPVQGCSHPLELRGGFGGWLRLKPYSLIPGPSSGLSTLAQERLTFSP